MNEQNDSKPQNAIELKTLNPGFEVKTGLIGIVLGIAALLLVTFINGLAESQGQGGDVSSWHDWVAFPLLLIGLGLLFGGGKSLFSIIQWKSTTYKNSPIQDVSCPSCNSVSHVNVREYAFFCSFCRQPLQWSPYKWTDDIDATQYHKLLEQGVSCVKCKTQNYIVDRPAWFMCPKCKSRVELERIPFGNKQVHSSSLPLQGTEEYLRMNPSNKIKNWGDKVYECPKCAKLNHLNDTGTCTVCGTKLTKTNVIANPFL